MVADAEEAGREATSRLSDMRGNVEKMRRRAESAEEKLADMEREKEANKLEKERLQTRIDGLQSKNRSLETELNKNRQKEEIDDLKRKLVAAIKSEKEIKVRLTLISFPILMLLNAVSREATPSCSPYSPHNSNYVLTFSS